MGGQNLESRHAVHHSVARVTGSQRHEQTVVRDTRDRQTSIAEGDVGCRGEGYTSSGRTRGLQEHLRECPMRCVHCCIR